MCNNIGQRAAARLVLGSLPVLFFLPLLFAGLYQDDLVLAVTRHGETTGLLQSVASQIAVWWSNGRFFPINVVLYESVFRHVDHDHHLAYHATQIVLIGLCFKVWITHVGRAAVATSTLLLATLLLLSVATVRPDHHDPYVAYHLQQPVFFLLFFTSLISLDRYLEQGRRPRHLITSLVLYVLALCTYEIAYPLIGVFFFMIARRSPRRVGLWVIYSALLIILVVFQAMIRGNAAADVYSGITVSLSFWQVLSSFVDQIFCVLPLSWLLGEAAAAAFTRGEGLHLREAFDVCVLLGVCLLTGWRVTRALGSRSRLDYLSCVGLLLWLLPALPIAASAKYQSELSLLAGYIPRYLQNFGFVMLVLPLLVRLSRARLAAPLLIVLAASTFAYNVHNIWSANAHYNASRMIFDTMRDDDFLRRQHARRVYVNRAYTYHPKAYSRVNDRVPLIASDPGQLAQGDKVLLIHPGAGDQLWAYWGTWGDGSVSDLHRVRPAARERTAAERGLRLAGWRFEPLHRTRPLADLQRELRQPKQVGW